MNSLKSACHNLHAKYVRLLV